MAFRDCIISARDQGAIAADEADDIIRRYERFKRARAGDPRGADMAAKDDLAADLAAEAARKRRLAELQEAATDRIRGDLAAFRGPDKRPDVLEAALSLLSNEQNRLAGYASVQGRATAITAYAHARLEELLHDQRRSWVSGRRGNRARLDHIIDEAYGTGTGDEAARRFWQAYRQVNDEFVGMFNAGGGQMPQIENYLPQKHDPRALSKAGLDAWRAFITPRLDRERMIDPFTQEPFKDERLAEVLEIAFKRLITDGWSDREPTMQMFGKGALANQRGEQRFLIFKDAPSWREYQNAFGSRDVFATLMDNLGGLARDIASLQVLGPNPSATVEWLKQVVRSEAGKAAAGEDTLFNPKGPMAKLAERAQERQTQGQTLIDNLWQEVRGGARPENYWAASTMAAVRNTLTGIQLSSAALTAISDPAVAAQARLFAGLPITRLIGDRMKVLAGENRREVLRAGLLVEDAMHHLGLNARYAGTLAGPEWSRWLPDRVLNWSGLTPWTDLGRRAEAFDFMSVAADRQGVAWDKLDMPYQRFLSGFGIDARDWEVIGKVAAHRAEPDAAGLLRPVDIAEHKHPRAFDIAMRYSEAMHAHLENAVPQGSARTRAVLKGGAVAGTAIGEVRLSMAMYLSFPLSFLASTLRGLAVEGGLTSARGATYAGSVLIGTTLLGGVALQLAQLRDGKDPRRMGTTRFWGEAMLKGGGLGFFGDYLLADVSRTVRDNKLAGFGPVGQLGGDMLAVAGARPFIDGDEKYNRSKEAVKFLSRYTPIANLWYTRAAYNRVVIDQLQYQVDPNAYRSMRERERRLERELQQGSWWRPGETRPDRAPDFTAIFGR